MKHTFFSGAGADDIIEMLTTNIADSENNSISESTIPTSSSYKSFYDLSFLNLLKKEDKLYMCGQLSSHCVEFNITDIVNSIASSSSSEICSENIFILKDAITTSNNLKVINKELEPALDNTTVGVSSNKDNEDNGDIEELIWNSLLSCGIKIIPSSEILV